MKSILFRICKPESPLGLEALTAKYYLPIEKIILESNLLEELKHIDKTDRINFLHKVRKHFEAAAEHLIKKTSFSNCLAKSLSILDPNCNVQNHKDIVKIAQAMPFDVSETLLINEYCLYFTEHHSSSNEQYNGRVDKYWANVVKNNKHPELAKVVKAALTLSHGNADVERGFSYSGHILTSDRTSLSQRTLDCTIMAKQCISYLYDGKIENIVITKDLLKLSRTAYVSYKQYCEEQNKIKEKKKQKEKEKEELEQQQIALKRKYEMEKTNIAKKRRYKQKVEKRGKDKKDTVNRYVKLSHSSLHYFLKLSIHKPISVFPFQIVKHCYRMSKNWLRKPRYGLIKYG